MNKILLASHGPLANGMKKTAEFLMGQNENVETLCAYVDEQSKDLPAMVEKWMNERNPEDQWVVITDIFGGSINNEFMIRAQEGGYWLIAGMNLPLVLSLWYETENLTEHMQRSIKMIHIRFGLAQVICGDLHIHLQCAY